MSKKLFEVRSSSIQGKGAFATQQIIQGMCIIEYSGERISHDEADRRYADTTNVPVVLFIVDDDIVIDGGVDGNEARYINHSCDPNCRAITDEDRIYIEALRTIQPGEELTFDYQLVRSDEYEPEWDTLYACHCGARNCRGTMLAPLKFLEDESG